MLCETTSQRRVAKATTAIIAMVVLAVVFILPGPPVEAQDHNSTADFSLSLNPYQFNSSAMNFWPAAHQFDSKSSFNSTLNGISRDLTVDGLFDNLDMLPGKAGDIGEKLNFGYQGWKLFSDTRESLQAIKEHPNDPGSDWERASIGMNFYSFFGTAELLLEAADGFGKLGTVVKATAEATRSRVMQNRAENLVFSGGMPLDIQEMRERMNNYDGDFSIRGTHVSAVGGWVLDHYSQRPFERDSLSYSWADTRVLNLRLNDGSLISGNFFRDVKYDERGGGPWNLYDPTSATITRRSQNGYHIYFNGANWNRDYQEAPDGAQPTKIPPPAVPSIASPKELPLPYANDTKYPPPTRYPIYGEPPKFTPAGIVTGGGRGPGGGAAFSASAILSFQEIQTMPRIGGVTMPVTEMKNSLPDDKADFTGMFQSTPTTNP